MNPRLRAATTIWRGRQPRAVGDRAYIAYSLVLFALIVGAPVLRAAWLAVTVRTTATAMIDPVGTATATTVVLAAWATALMVGRSRGPAVAAPFLAHALTSSDLPGRTTFGRQTLAGVAVLAAVGGGGAAFLGAASASVGLVAVGSALGFGVRGLLIGVLTGLCWLFGQAAPRAAAVLAAVLGLGAVAIAFLGPHAALSAWAWVTPTPGVPGILVLGAVAVVGAVVMPWLLDRIRGVTISAQSAQWNVAIAHAVSLDFAAASGSYQALPTAGRRLHAILDGAVPVVMVSVRDAVGAVRTPARLVGGVLTIAAAGLALVLAAQSAAAAPLLGAVAAALLYVGAGASTRGVQHVAQVSRDQPLYGFSDGSLLLLHCIFPVAFSVVITLASTVVVGAVGAVGAASPVASPIWAAIALPAVVVAARVSNALRGPSPLFLMTPAPSAVGDPMPLLRILWALDAPLLAILAGSAAGAGSLPAIVAVTVVIALFLLFRWARRA
ncbi:hypothetical protein [Curtobacterium sp. VKM Ac-2922]|uniref:hypothetical protein n=1 Tax=Curtobacterium sp. VKM Ac-2922 TaxID=2929475 RepID=UPI001FB22F8E|nr:hypothetical protein [Curtobacterium sp. VKM Ac-2922]MCJ1715120.1 hypothetical protein [Curtobacterium sp. VKM Ac-2922]